MTWLCQLFGISRQAYYKRLKAAQSKASIEIQVRDMVLNLRHTFPRMGGRKLFFLLQAQLDKQGIRIGRDRFFQILRKHRLMVPKRKNYHVTTQSKHRFFKYPNRLKGVSINQPEQVWVSDITYIKTKSAHSYLHLVTDAYSKKIMGYELSDNLKTESTLKALNMAVNNRRYPDRKLTHHSDRGFQYCNDLYTDFLETHNIEISMTEKYDPYENAIAERVNGILKDEFGLDQGFKHHLQAVEEVRKAINLYNHQRPHLSCGMLFPYQAHQADKPLKKLWKNKSHHYF